MRLKKEFALQLVNIFWSLLFFFFFFLDLNLGTAKTLCGTKLSWTKFLFVSPEQLLPAGFI